jgi:hypothetical protein
MVEASWRMVTIVTLVVGQRSDRHTFWAGIKPPMASGFFCGNDPVRRVENIGVVRIATLFAAGAINEG